MAMKGFWTQQHFKLTWHLNIMVRRSMIRIQARFSLKKIH